MLGLKESTYYYKPKSHKKIEEDVKLKFEIEKLHEELPGYGYRRVTEHFKKNGIVINKKRIQRVMQDFGLHSVLKRKSVPFRSYSTEPKCCFKNLIKGLSVTGIDQVWVTDMTFIKIDTGFIFLSAVLDVYSRKIVGWALSRKLDHKLCVASIQAALKNRKRSDGEGIIHHSDQGSQYTSNLYVNFLEGLNFKISMSKRGTPTENGYIEAFFKTLKHEEILVKKYSTLDEIKAAVPRFIDGIYNEKRLHSGIGYQTPIEFEFNIINNMELTDRPVQEIA
jgi:putative transposase